MNGLGMVVHPRQLVRMGLAAAMVVAVFLVPRPAAAHDVPDELVFYAHVAPEADRLHVPLRVPLVLLLDYGLPKRGPGYIDLADAEGLDAALAVVTDDLADDIVVFEGGERLEPGVAGWRLSLPSDRSFEDYHEAVASIAGPPLPSDTNLFWNQGYLDVHFTYPIAAETSTFSLLVDSPGLAERLHVLTTFVAPDGSNRSYDLLGTMGRVELNPGSGYLLRLFSAAGLSRFLSSWEHVLFVAALAIALGRRPAAAATYPARPLIAFGAVSSLIVVAAGPTAGVDSRFFELLVAVAAAATLVVVAIGNIVARDLRHRWLTAAVCAVPHGLLLAGGLEVILQFRIDGAVLPLAAYAVGAQVGATAVFVAALAIGWLVARHAGARRHGPVIAALLLGYVGWHYTLQRGEVLREVPLPAWDRPALAGAARWGALLMLVVAALWLAFELYTDRRGRADESAADHPPDPRQSPTVADEAAGPAPAEASGNGHAPTFVGAGGGQERSDRTAADDDHA